LNRTIFITGATSGIGKACAEKFAAVHDNLIINGRRSDRLEELKSALEEKYNVKVYISSFDVRDKTAVSNAIQNLPGKWREIDILINNAGLAVGRELFDSAELEDWEIMINTNISGLLYVTKALLPFMTVRNQGHIINLGSVAAKEIYERGNVYCATKAAVDAISKSMRIDLLAHNIKVTAIHPGAVETEFAEVRFKGDKEKASGVYDGFTPLSAEDIANTIFYVASLPPHVCINDLVITPTAQANSIYFYKK
jgi:NADP-dependent 3-hydroxy acid dehydrogenase YdfG